jgi:uncharacterized protein YjbJ (UPF0337 family)
LLLNRLDEQYKESGMNWDQIEGKWKQLKGSAKERWGKLTDDDLDTIAGKRDQLAGQLQEKYGITREQAEAEIDQWRTAHAERTAADDRRIA